MSPILSFKQNNRLKPAWVFDAGALVWRIFFAKNRRLTGEARNPEEKTTSFFCIDLKSGKPLWNKLQFDEQWWIGIETVYEEWLILHGYVRPDIPEHRGISVIDIESGKLLWKNDEYTFWFTGKDSIYAHRYLFEKHIGAEFDIRTGAQIREYKDDLETLLQLRQELASNEVDQQVVFPELFDAEGIKPEILQLVKQVTDNKALEGWIEYFVNNNQLILSYYIAVNDQSKPPLLDNILSVVEINSGSVVFKETIAKGVQAPSPDSFFIIDDMMVFISHQTHIIGLPLTHPV